MINGIDYEKFLADFLLTDTGKAIQHDFDEVVCSQGYSPLLELKRKAGLTFREMYGKKDYVMVGPTSISITTLYYLQFLLETSPTAIHDIGCGWNIWKRYYPQIVGIDFDSKFADISDKFNDDFINRHREQLESVMSVNMYLGLKEDNNNTYGFLVEPITFENYIDQIIYFAQILKPGGRAYVSQNKLGFLKYTRQEWFDKYNVSKYNYSALSKILLDDLKENFPYKILSFDCELDILDSMTFDGCVRLVFEKT
jgi:hypothetical protein